MNNTYGSQLTVALSREPWFGNEVRVLIWMRTYEAGQLVRKDVAQPLTFKQVDPDDVAIEILPTFSLEPGMAQHLMDELWRIGLRPTEGSGSAGALAATQEHLEDLRALVFKRAPRKGTE